MMDKYVFLVILLAPGFIASTTARFCGNFPDKNSEFGHVMRYFAYSFFSLTLSVILMCVAGIFSMDDTWSMIADKMAVTSNGIAFVLISLTVSIFTGVSWSFWLKSTFSSLCNWLGGKGKIGVGDRVVDDFIKAEDGPAPILLEVIKGDTSLIGFANSISTLNSDDFELSLWNAEGYREWLNSDQCRLIKTYINFDKDIILKRYSYPAEWVERQAL